MISESPDSAEEAVAGEPGTGAPPGRGYALQPVVGLGGSAGAIPALVTFLQSTRPCGLAYVVILHLAPEHESTLAELLQRHTEMPVHQVLDTVRVRADTVYVIPPRHALHMVDGDLQLGPMPADRPGRVAVDLFFRTLADTHGPHATAIVLSGLDSDGAIGIKRIKERGGLTIAQDPEEAQHQGMPRAAIATGMVDWVLPVAEMPQRVARYVELEQHLSLPPELEPEAVAGVAVPGTEGELREVLSYLRTRTGRDFANYKRATILRRIGRRMQVNGVRNLPDYLGCLRTRPGEAAALLQDLLISVTNFFRDAECFAALEQQVEALFRDKSPTGVIRVWVAACATGEEAYSIAILLSEHARTLEMPPALQIFATDLDEDAIRVAREGVYAPTIAADVSEERLRRFFTKEHRGYRVRRELREQVLFAAHDVLKDSPFSRLDLVSCRNLLIYLNRDAQRRVFETAHFALLPGGRLFLGASETVEDNSQLFSIVDKKHRLYAPRPVPRLGLPVPSGQSSIARALKAHDFASSGVVMPGSSFALGAAEESRGQRAVTGSDGRSVARSELHFKMLELLAPPSIVIDSEYEILHLSPNAGRFLQFGGGEPSRNLLHAIHPALRIELRGAIYQVVQNQARTEVAPLPIDLAGTPAVVRLAVTPMYEVAPGMLLVTIEALRDEAAAAALPPSPVGDENPLSHLLDRELERLKSHLRDTVEQYEASTEELKASNEELQAMNEELRSATEELETSREELQSINEELTTVNHELKSKVDELGHANSDMQNLMDATAIATVFLDRELRVTRYTPSAVALFNLIPTDVGRPLSNLTNQLDYPQLDADARRVLQGLVPVEREVDDAQGHWYLVRMLPYRTGDDRIAGIVLTLVDISERKRSQEALRLSEERFGAIADKAAVGVLQTSRDGVTTFVNSFMCELLGQRERDLIGRPMLEIVHPEDRAESERLLGALPEGGSFQVEKRLLRKDGSILRVHNSVSQVSSADGAVLVVCIDVSERKAAEDALRVSEERLRLIIDNATEYAIFATDLERRVTSWNSGAERLLGWVEGDILGRQSDVVFTDEERSQDMAALEVDQALAGTRPTDEREHQRKNGERFWATGALMPMRDPGGEVIGFVKILRDKSAERQAREQLATSRRELEQALDDNQRARTQLEAADLAKDRFLAVLSHELRNPLAAVAGAAKMVGHPAHLDGAGRARAQTILDSQIEAMKQLLDDLLDISRLRFGRLALKKQRVTLAQVVEQAVDTTRPLVDARRHELRVALPQAPVVLFADPLRLGQVLSNLLANAARYTDDGGHIVLSARTEGDECVIEVSDDGRGLDEDTLRSMFEMFWRSGELDAAGAHSMGIGLALARSVANLHEGSISAASGGLGQGSTFTVRLPLQAEPAAAAAPAPVARAAGNGATHAAVGPLRLLIADDNEDVAWTLGAVLEVAGFQVRTAIGGQEAIAAVDEFTPDVVVLDLAMPGMSGYEVAERLRRTEQGRAMVLVAATGWGSESDRQASASAGFDAHLIKPVSAEELQQVIAELWAARD